MKRLIVMVAAATLASYVLLAWVGLVQLNAQAGGLIAFDARITGYNQADATAYLAELTDEGRAIILGPLRILDTIFPVLLGLLLALIIWVNGRPYLAILPFGYTAVDLWENATVGRMIAENAPEMADRASNLTQGKYALLLLAVAVAWMVWRRHSNDAPSA